jgi:hypothetical protein
MRRLRPHTLLLFLALVLAFAVLAGGREAKASGPLIVTVQAPAGPALAGADATFIIRAEGDSPAAQSLDFSVVGGTLSGAVALNEVAPGVAEGAAFVRRETPGQVILTVLVAGRPVATGSVTYADAGRVEVQLALEAGHSAAARTWRFEVLDAPGNVVTALSIGTSGDAPLGVGRTDPLPFGSYSVRPVLRTDTQLSCSPGVTYEVSPPSGDMVSVSPGEPLAPVRFSVRLCPGASQQAATGGMAGTREILSATPLPPESGKAPTVERAGSRQGWRLAMLVGLLLTASLILLPGLRRSPAGSHF